MGFTFHANTLAFGGQLDVPGKRTQYLPSQASVALPPDGGVGEATLTDFQQDGVSFYRADSRVLGNAFDQKLFKTFANVSVAGLDIEGRIQADVLNATVTSINERVGGRTGESRIWFDVNIVGLVIDGTPIEVEFDTELYRRHSTFDEFVGAFGKLSEPEMTERAEAFNWPIEECRTLDGEKVSFHVPKRCSTGIRASLLRRTYPRLAPGEVPGVTRRGYTIEVSGFGLVHLGEVLLKAGRRRVNLMRVELGKTFDGSPSARISMATAGQEPRLRAIALSDALEPAGVVPAGGGYTLCSGEGNGTDFLP